MTRDLRRALDEEPPDDARIWKPAVGDELIGRIVRRDSVLNKFKPDTPSDRLVIHEDNGEHWIVYCNHTVLRNKIQALNPQVGDRIAVRRIPDHPEKNYPRYIVIVDRAADQAMPSDPDDSIAF